MSMTAIVYGYNELEILKICINTLKESVKEVDYIIAVGNGSTDGTIDWLREQTDIDIAYFDDGIQPYGRMLNDILSEFEIYGDLLTVPASYIAVPSGVERLSMALRDHADVGIIVPVTNNPGGMYSIGNIDKYSIAKSIADTMEYTGDIHYTLGFTDGVYLIRKEALLQTGLFDDRLQMMEKAIDDYALRVISNGYRIAYCEQAVFFDSKPEQRKDLYPADSFADTRIMYEKWDMHYFNKLANWNLIQLIEDAVDKQISILEIGCDCGATLLEIKHKYKNAQVHGIELNEQAAAIASAYVDTTVCNIENMDLDYAEHQFDYIVFGDVLANLRNPESVVRYCRKFLKESGCILASIPNLMHVSVLKDLINGNFTYTETGLLNKAHIHMFTYNEIVRMFTNCEYNVEHVNYVEIPSLQDDNFTGKLMKLSEGTPKYMFDTFQYVVRARMIDNAMKPYQILQKNIHNIAEVPYEGVYLWKYLIDELSAGLNEAEDFQKSIIAKVGYISDEICFADQQRVQELELFLEHLPEKTILFAIAPFLRRLYGDKYEHTVMDSYINTIEDDQYIVLEPMTGISDDMVLTKNRVLFDMQAVVTKYGVKEVNKNDLARHIMLRYVAPLQKLFSCEIPKEKVINVVLMSSLIMKERDAYIHFYREVLKKVKPKVICYSHAPIPWIAYLHEAAQQLGIPTVEIAHGAGAKTIVYPKELEWSDFYFTRSRLEQQKMKEFGFKNIYCVGKPGIYRVMQEKQDYKSSIVISFISSVEPDLFEMAVDLAKCLPNPQYVVVYKSHSSEVLEEDDLKRADEAGVSIINGDVDVRRVYNVTDIIVGERSTAITDALPYDRIKILVINRPISSTVCSIDYLDQLVKLKDIISVDTEQDIMREVLSYEIGRKYRNIPNNYWPEESDYLFRKLIEKIIEKQISPE